MVARRMAGATSAANSSMAAATCEKGRPPIRRFIPEITQKMLTAHLRELEEHGGVSREIYLEVPPRVEYSFTEYGQSIIPILQSLQEWGMNHLSRLQQNHDGSTGTRT